MANVLAVKSGNWSDTTVWNTGALPANVDNVFANNYVVTVDGNYTVANLTNGNWIFSTATNGGTFVLSNNITLTVTSNVIAGNTSTNSAITFALNGGDAATLNCGILYAGTTVGYWGCRVTGTGTLTVNGNISGSDLNGSGVQTYGLYISAAANVNINGNLYVGGQGQSAVYIGAIANTNIVGSLFGQIGAVPGGVTANGTVVQASGGTLNVTGFVYGTGSQTITTYGGYTPAIINNSGGGTVNITGVVYGAGGNITSIPRRGVINSAGGNVNITGTVQAITQLTTTGFAYGVDNSGTGNTTITGTCIGGLGNGSTYAAINSGSGTMRVIGTCIGGAQSPAVGGGSASQVTLLSGPILCNEYYGTVGVSAFAWRWINAFSGTYMTLPTSNYTYNANLYTSNYATLSQYPANSNVRVGVSYGPLNEYTGTMAVPPANSVAFGVPTGNTTGTIVFDANTLAEMVWNVAVSNIATSGTIGNRLKNSATIDVVGDQLESLV